MARVLARGTLCQPRRTVPTRDAETPAPRTGNASARSRIDAAPAGPRGVSINFRARFKPKIWVDFCGYFAHLWVTCGLNMGKGDEINNFDAFNLLKNNDLNEPLRFNSYSLKRIVCYAILHTRALSSPHEAGKLC